MAQSNPPARIRYRCWYCNRQYDSPNTKSGERIKCSCGHTLKVPRRSYGRTRCLTVGERLIEMFVYGFGGALLFFLGSLFVVSRVYGLGAENRIMIIAATTVSGFLLCGFGGEPVVNYFGRMIRDREDN
jgi:DNA-directed RNA polymerase subunit RPC12/RpoP